jgi:hypothetical protein
MSDKNTPRQTSWTLDSLEKIGGHKVTVNGSPKVVSTPQGPGVSFNGNGDFLLVHGNPLGDAKAFTVEIFLNPGAGSNATNDPRFFHIMDPADPESKRLIIEIRVNDQGKWWFDSMLVTDAGQVILADASLLHPTGQWVHTAVTYDGSTLRNFVNGREETKGAVAFKQVIFPPGAVTSIGARMNDKFWLLGTIGGMRFTQAALDPKDFLKLG